jgi:ABC-type anion transport system duplicated permease subunit
MIAFGAATLFHTIGLFLGTLISAHFCTKTKIYVFIGLNLIGLVCYIILDIKRNIKQQKVLHDNQSVEENAFEKNDYENIEMRF